MNSSIIEKLLELYENELSNLYIGYQINKDSIKQMFKFIHVSEILKNSCASEEIKNSINRL